MLNAEEARARLEAIADPEWRAKAEKRAGKVRRRHRRLAAALLARDPVHTDQQGRDRHREHELALAAELDGLSERDRVEVMTALHPGLGPTLARWWVDSAGQPYTVGWARKAFRGPNSPMLTRATRMATLRRTVAALGPYPGDPAWLAAWAPHIGFGPYTLGVYGDIEACPLLAAAMTTAIRRSSTP